MIMKNTKKNIFVKIFAGIAPLFFTVAVMAMIVYGLNETEKSSKAEGLRILEESLHRAITKCYAVEGSYPSNLAYIEKFYGVHIDRTKYVVDYDIFASNIMPSVMVIELQ